MSEQFRKAAAAEQVECAVSAQSGNAPGNRNGELRVVTDKLDRALKLLTELADDVGKIAPEHKHIFEDARAAVSDFGALLTQAPDGVNGRVTRIVAPMPGVVIRCEKKAGEQVKKGEVVFILDAMKVENPIQVPVAGKIISIRHREGERVAKGSVLAVVNQ